VGPHEAQAGTLAWAAARALSIGVAFAGVGAGAGCGAGPAEDTKVRAAVTDYLDAISAQRYDDACKLLHSDVRKTLGRDCARGLAQRYTKLSLDTRDELDDINVAKVDVDGSSAMVNPAQIRAVTKVQKKVNGKDQTHMRYHPAPDVTGGAGFSLKKVGNEWKITAGV
jgi:hypothetical protein